MYVALRIERELQLAADPSKLGAARDFAGAAAEQYGFDPDERYDFVFAASEAVANAIEHGSPSAESTVRMRLTEEDGALVLYVEDSGQFLPTEHRSEALPDRGRGLAFMAVLVDEVDLCKRNGGTLVRLVKRRRT